MPMLLIYNCDAGNCHALLTPFIYDGLNTSGIHIEEYISLHLPLYGKNIDISLSVLCWGLSSKYAGLVVLAIMDSKPIYKVMYMHRAVSLITFWSF